MGDAHPTTEALDASLDAATGGLDRPMATHVQACGVCAGRVGELRRVRRGLAAMTDMAPELPPDWDALVARVMAVPSRTEPTPAQRPRARRPVVLVAAAVAGGVLIGVPGYRMIHHAAPSAASVPPATTGGGSPAARTVRVESSGTRYTRANASQAVRRLTTGGTQHLSVVADAPVPSSTCALPGPAARASFIDHGRFDGQPATVYLTRDDDSYTAIFVSPRCRITVLRHL